MRQLIVRRVFAPADCTEGFCVSWLDGGFLRLSIERRFFASVDNGDFLRRLNGQSFVASVY